MGLLGRIMALFLAFAAPASGLTIELHDAEVSGRMVRLGDIAVFGGVTHAEADSLAASIVGCAPAAGMTRPVPAETIRMAVLRHGYLPQEIRFNGAPTVQVTRLARTIDPERVAGEVLASLKPLVPADVTLTVQRVSAIQPLPLGELTFEVQAPRTMERTFIAPVLVTAGGERVMVSVTCKAARFGRVLQAARRLERGVTVQEGDLEVRTADLFEAPRGAISDPVEAVGCVVVRAIAPGTVLTAASVERPALVARGDRVVVTARIPGIEVSMTGTALEPGRMGEIIRIRNQASGRMVTGRVTGAGEVMIVE